MSELHIPKTLPGGIFSGETGNAEATLNTLVLDDSRTRELNAPFAVNHDQRKVSRWLADFKPASEPNPPALRMPYTEERRDKSNLDTGWEYVNGEVVNLRAHTGQHITEYTDNVLTFNGVASQTGQEQRAQTLNYYDFQYRVTVPDIMNGTVTRTPTAYRGVIVNSWAYYRLDTVKITTTLEALIENVWIPGRADVGRTRWEKDRYMVVTKIHEQKYDVNGLPIRTRADYWMPIARRDDYWPSSKPDNATPEYSNMAVGEMITSWVRISTDETDPPVAWLRDMIPGPEPAPLAAPGQFSFQADQGQVRVTGTRTNRPGTLALGSSLSAYGQTFQGGTWAALRDTPTWTEELGWNFAPLIILHEKGPVISAVRRDGSIETCTRELFESEVLRVPPGSFKGFSSVGALSHSWPPQWAWAVCGAEHRALAAHDPWRDSYREKAPDPSPPTWTWKARPGKRPRVLPTSAPRGVLGLTLADVAGQVMHEERIARGEGPLQRPATAVVGKKDVLKSVSKRILYQPAEWPPDELKDSLSAGSPLSLTFPPPPPTMAGETLHAALLIRYRGRETSVLVNGARVGLNKLGHNADQKRGWHSYTLDVPYSRTYTITHEGRISLALLCVRALLVTPTGGGGTAA